jgi:hypothetical protein
LWLKSVHAQLDRPAGADMMVVPVMSLHEDPHDQA